MSRLIQMRQRIKAIETTKKVTHAMRLISMSSHTRLRAKNNPLKQYKLATQRLFHRIRNNTPEWQHPIMQSNDKKTTKQLIILIGSQKGLCGNFNSALFKFFETKTTPELLANTDVIAIGKKAADFIRAETTAHIIAQYDFNATNLLSIATELTNNIIINSTQYSSAFIYSNEIVSFFAQNPRKLQLIPFEEDTSKEKTTQPTEPYEWEQSPSDILDFLLQQTVETEIQHQLFESLLAEQAARFISMDNATRNANNLLETTRLQYNKLRQAKITKELTELTGSL